MMNNVTRLNYMFWSFLVLLSNSFRVDSFVHPSSSWGVSLSAVPNICRRKNCLLDLYWKQSNHKVYNNKKKKIIEQNCYSRQTTRIRSTSGNGDFPAEDNTDDDYEDKNRELRFSGVGRYVFIYLFFFVF